MLARMGARVEELQQRGLKPKDTMIVASVELSDSVEQIAPWLGIPWQAVHAAMRRGHDLSRGSLNVRTGPYASGALLYYERTIFFKFPFPADAKEPKELAEKLLKEGICQIGPYGHHISFVNKVGEENGKAPVLAEISDPDIIRGITSKVGEGSPIEIEVEENIV